MDMVSIYDYLRGNAYPGRGVAVGKTADGKNAALIYFIMGRSVNSRNRVFEPYDGGIRTRAFDEALLTDPSLIIYAPVRLCGPHTIVTNGDQTDTVFDSLAAGGSFEDALRTREYEPDAPNFTPRISGIATVGETFSYKLSILKKTLGGPGCERFFYEYAAPEDGVGHLIHTYACDGDPIPSFCGEPVAFGVGNDLEAVADGLLDAENKVSLFVRFVSLADGTARTALRNKNQ